MKFCIFCDNEAEFVIDNTNAPICPACKQVYISGQTNPRDIMIDLPDEDEAIKKRLEYLRGEIKAERISYDEIVEIQGLRDYIDPDDVVLLEWAGKAELTTH